MPVTLTSPVLGQAVGSVYTGPEEDYLLAEGYARRDGYTGPGVSNTGPTDVTPDLDLELAPNREAAPAYDEDTDLPDPEGVDYDFDGGGINDDLPPSDITVEPSSGPATGGTVVTISGSNIEGVTAVLFDSVAATAVTQNDDGTVTATTPAGTAGPADVALTNSVGTSTEAGAFTYNA